MSKGFSMIEMLVSILIFVFVLIGVYAIFDQGQWLYLAGQKRANIAENGRVLIEQIERDFRLIGYGVPTSLQPDGTGPKWTPAIFSGGGDSIGFTSDIDNGNEIMTKDAGTGSADRIGVENTLYYTSASGGSPIPIVLVSDRKKWLPLNVSGVENGSIGPALVLTSDVTSTATFTADMSEVYTLERVFYRYVANASYPYGTVERQLFSTNDSSTGSQSPVSSDWLIVGNNVVAFSIAYYDKSGTVLTPVGSPALLTATNAANVARIVVTLTCRDRSSSVGQTQDIQLTSDILLRSKSS